MREYGFRPVGPFYRCPCRGHPRPPARAGEAARPAGRVRLGGTDVPRGGVLQEWHDYRLRGKTQAFYVKERGSYRAKAAERRGTWGVGRDYYRVRTAEGEVFDLYYDRAPQGPGERKGAWFLWRQILE